MLFGLDRPTATRFSFYLAIPTLGVATRVNLLSSFDQLTAGDFGRLLLGALVACIVAWFSIGWLLRYVARICFIAFGISGGLDRRMAGARSLLGRGAASVLPDPDKLDL